MPFVGIFGKIKLKKIFNRVSLSKVTPWRVLAMRPLYYMRPWPGNYIRLDGVLYSQTY